MNRRQLIQAGAAAALSTPLLLEASTAEAMGARINQRLQLSPHGVFVTGTFTSWDADELTARVSVHIVQGNEIGTGMSRRYDHGATTWAAFAIGEFRPGSAVGHATAIVALANGQTEFYKWTVSVTLVS